MIVEKIMYTAKCDHCGKLWESDSYCAWSDKESVNDVVEFDDSWYIEDGKHYCPDCFVWGDEDDEKPTIYNSLIDKAQ